MPLDTKMTQPEASTGPASQHTPWAMAPPKRTFLSRLPHQTRHLVWVLFSLSTMGTYSWQLRISANSPTVNTNLWVGNKKTGHLQRPCHSKVQSKGTIRVPFYFTNIWTYVQLYWYSFRVLQTLTATSCNPLTLWETTIWSWSIL